MKPCLYFSVAFLMLSFSIKGHAQSYTDTLLTGIWAPSMPLEMLEQQDTLSLVRKPEINYGYLEFLRDSAIMIGGNVRYSDDSKDNPYAARIEYRWYVCGHWFSEGDTLEIISDGVIYVCKKLPGDSDNLKFIVQKRTVQYPK